jgi:hypothetical protein
MENFKNKAKAILDLQQRGYDQDFILAKENIYCIQRGNFFPPDNFEVTESYRFESKSRLKDSDIIYAIRSVRDGLKGILMISHSALAQGVSINLWSKLAFGLSVNGGASPIYQYI